MSCSVCLHPECQAIDQALLARTATLAQLSDKYQLSTSALQRHKQHLLKKMPQVHSRFQAIVTEGCLFILNSFLEMILRATRTAEAEGNSRLVLQAVRQGTAILKFMHKLDFPLTPDSIHRLLSNPNWAAQGSLLPTDPQFFLGSRQALAQSLASPCPEPGSEPENAPETGLPDLAGLNPNQLLYLLTELVPSLGEPEGESTAAKREKGGKKPGNAPGQNNNAKQNQHDMLCVKNAGKCPPASPITDSLRPGHLRLKGHPGSLLTGLEASENTRSWVRDLD